MTWADGTRSGSLGRVMVQRAEPSRRGRARAAGAAGLPLQQRPHAAPRARGHAQAVVLPGSAEEVAALVAWCYEHDVPLVPRGGGTGLAGGAVPTEGGVVVLARAAATLSGARRRPVADARRRPASSPPDVQQAGARERPAVRPRPRLRPSSHDRRQRRDERGRPHTLKYGVTGAGSRACEAVLAPGELVAGRRLGGQGRRGL